MACRSIFSQLFRQYAGYVLDWMDLRQHHSGRKCVTSLTAQTIADVVSSSSQHVPVHSGSTWWLPIELSYLTLPGIPVMIFSPCLGKRDHFQIFRNGTIVIINSRHQPLGGSLFRRSPFLQSKNWIVWVLCLF